MKQDSNFKNIEKNLKKEILDDSFCSDNNSAESAFEESFEEIEPQNLGLDLGNKNKGGLNRLQIFS